MTWTYDPALPTDRDKVRALIQDIDTAHQLIHDEVLDFFLTESGTLRAAAAKACRAIAAKFARDANTSVVGTSHSPAPTRTDQYLKLAEQLDGEAARLGVPTAGGIEQSEKDTAAKDTGLVARAFRLGQHDHPGTGVVDARIA